MRGSGTVIVSAALVGLLTACGGGSGSVARPVAGSAAPSSGASVAPSGAGRSSSAPVQRPDLVPKMVNPDGTPPCGYHTYVTEAASIKYTMLGLAVAVHPAGSTTPVQVVISIEGSTEQFTSTMSSNGVESGRSIAGDPGGLEFPTGELGNLWFDPVVNETVGALLDQPRIVTVTVDPNNRIRESNENNNSVRMRLGAVPNRPKRTTRTAPVINYRSANCTVL